MFKDVNTAPIKYVNDNLLILSNRVTYDKVHIYLNGGIENENVELFN